MEADLAAKRTTYAVLNLSERKLYFKVRGRAFKAISFTGLEATRRSEPVDLGQIAWRAFTLQIKEGKGVETESIQRKVLSPEEAQKAGRSDAEGEPIGAEQGVVESGAVAPGGTPPAGAGGADSAAALFVADGGGGVADFNVSSESLRRRRAIGCCRSDRPALLQPR